MAACSSEALTIFKRIRAYIEHTHAVFTSGKHSGSYINKDAVYSHTAEIARLCRILAERFAGDYIEVVVGPAVGGVVLTQWMAHHLSDLTVREVLAAYGEKVERTLFKTDSARAVIKTGLDVWDLEANMEVVVRHPSKFVIERGYDKLLAGKRCLCVEDILSTGGSAKGIVEATQACGGLVVGLGALWNRGAVTASQIGNLPKFVSLIDIQLDMWDEDECPLCMAQEPVDTDIGHGREYLAKKALEEQFA